MEITTITTSVSSLIMDCIEDKIMYQNEKPRVIQLSKMAHDMLLEEVKQITNFNISKDLMVFSGYPVNIDEYAQGIKIVVY